MIDALAELESASKIAGLLRARSVAVVGASERSIWSRTAFSNFKSLRFKGAIYPVNPKGGVIHGVAAARRCAEIGVDVDAALVMVPTTALSETLADLREAGICNAVLLASGLAELGEEGSALQTQIADNARDHGITLLGPNCLGFVNYADRVPIWTSGLPSLRRGSIAIVSQSGATARYVALHADQQGLGLSHLVSTGNEAHLTAAAVVEFLVDDPATKVILLFLEATRDADTLARAASRAHQAGKPIIVLKVGTSAVAAEAAQSHTGSMVGDDAVFSAACRRYGMLRVDSIETMIATATLLNEIRPKVGKSFAALAISGGICEIAADRAEALAAPFARLDNETQHRLRDVLPVIATPSNPLDVTGAAMLEPAIFERATRELGKSADAAMLACLFEFSGDIPTDFESAVLAHVGSGASQAAIPAAMISVSPTPVAVKTRRLARKHGLAYLGSGLHHGIAAIVHAIAWQGLALQPPVSQRNALDERPLGELATVEFLRRNGVATVPMQLVTSVAEVSAAFTAMGGNCVAKVASPDIAHKTEIGGVRLNLTSVQAAECAYRDLCSVAGERRPDARLDGIVFGPMRPAGVELFVGVNRDPQWGQVLAIGLGGVWIEALKDSSLRLLPVTVSDIHDMLGELRGSILLDGYRGSPPVDKAVLAEQIALIARAVSRLGPDLVSFETNPLLASRDRVEVLDALAIWKERPSI